jgi:cysteine synthase
MSKNIAPASRRAPRPRKGPKTTICDRPGCVVAAVGTLGLCAPHAKAFRAEVRALHAACFDPDGRIRMGTNYRQDMEDAGRGHLL